MTSSSQQRRDTAGIVLCGVLFVVGALVLYASMDFSTLGAVFPRTVAAVMMVFCVAYAVTAWRPAHPPAAAAEGGGSSVRRIGLFLVMLLWAVVLPTVGFLLTSIVAYVLITLLANYGAWTPRKVLNRAVAGTLILVGFYVLFRNFLYVPLPTGFFL